MNTELATPEQNPLALLGQMDLANTDPDKIGQLMALQEKWEANEAKKAYFSSLSEFQQRAPIIEQADDAHGKKYARMDRIWRTIRPLFTEMGLSLTWQSSEIKDGVCQVRGTLGHRLGHSTSITHDTPLPEMIRGQNAAQQAGSAQTYAKRYALCAALGLVTGTDDDAHSVDVPTISAVQEKEIEELLATIDDMTVMDSLLKWAEVESIELLPASKFKETIRSLKSKIA